MDNAALARKIRFLMETQHVTVPQLAERLGIRRSTIQDIVDRKAEASTNTLRQIAHYFGVDLDYFEESGVEPEGPVPSLKPNRAATTAAAKEKAKEPEPLTLRTLAIRYQGLVELLVEKGVFTAAEYHDHIKRVENRHR